MSLTTERWSAIERLFHAASECDTAARGAFLDDACGDDRELRLAVERLLAADGYDELLEGGVLAALRPQDPLLQQAFGPYRLVTRIAEGGMGAVYRAVRVEGEFQQEVAVKVLHLGLSGSRTQELFAQERQTLARLSHPNVARLLDGGTTAAGVSFIAMELIDGQPLDVYCDARGATLRQRLELFAVVCRAVHFAHRNLVVHLDLKPGNILVDGNGVPKLLDFGVAALLDHVAGSKAATRSRPLTPEYASPEQLRGEPVTTAADVYSLGAVLYELLTGVRPGRREADGNAVAACDTEALRPSATFQLQASAEAGAVTPQLRAERRGGSTAAMARHLRGDLDRIVMMALRQEPSRRYASCQEFADDIQRCLDGFPVIARPLGVGYRLVRFARRNRVGVGIGALLLLSLVAGLVTTLQLAAVARQQRDAALAAQQRIEIEKDHARIEATSSRLAAAFLGDTLLTADFAGTPTLRERLRQAVVQRAEQARREHADAPHLRANLLDALGQACLRLDLFADAEKLMQEAADIRVDTFGRHHLEYGLSLSSIGRLRYEQGRFAEAVEVLTACYRLQQECADEVHSDLATAANDLAAAVRATGDRVRARELHRQALQLRRRAGGDSVLVAESLNNLANSEDDPEQQAALLAEALAIRRRVLGDGHPLTWQSAINLARVRIQHGDYEAAKPLLQDAIAQCRRAGDLGDDCLSRGVGTLALVEARAGNAAAAAAAIAEAIAIDRRRYGDTHPRLASDFEIEARVAERAADHAAAMQAWQEVLRIKRAGDRRPAELADTMVELGAACEGAANFAAAEQAWLEALAIYQADAARRPQVQALQTRLAGFYRRRGRHQEAEQFAAAARR